MNKGLALWQPLAAAVGGIALAVFATRLDTTNDLRAKGGDTAFEVFVLRDGQAQPLPRTCRAGESLRARYHSRKPYLLILEIDGAGHRQVLFSAGEKTSAAIGEGSRLTPGSWVLDARPGTERFVALFSDRSLKLSDAEAALGAAETPLGVHRIEVVCDKELF